MNILLVDDHALFRAGFKLMLADLWDTQPNVVEVSSAELGLAATGREQFDLIFLDFGLPGLDGIDGLRAFRRACPATCIVVLSAVEGAETVRQALVYGAQGYIPKSVSAEVMIDAVRQILDGVTYAPIGLQPDEGVNRLDDVLTPRQVEVLSEICTGRGNREIGEQLGMSENTVRAHISAIFRQLGVRTRTEAALLAKRKGFL